VKRAAILVMLLGAGPACATRTHSAPAAHAKVNLNTATAEQLAALPGINGKEAKAIVQFRAKHGPFKTVDDVTKVKGVGKKDLAKIRGSAVVQSP
jgi:competence protein ComEA